VVHESGHVIGDVNHGNLFVGDRATVRLIDCDSYQITINGSRWFCEVGTPTHQPPEFQNIKTYKRVLRTPNHDNFGLAVIVFQMLFMARHPFSGRFLGTVEMPMERAISEYRFAYGSNAAAMQMQPPPASLGLSGVTRDLALLFERAFSRQGSQPNGRPQAREWVTALQEIEGHLKKCPVNPAHQFVDTLNKCPWCDVEAATGVPLFQVALVGSAQTGFTIAALWGKVSSVPNPGPPPALPRVEGRTVSLSPEGLELQQATWGARIGSGLLALTGFNSRIRSLKREIEKKAADARTRWHSLQNNWNSYTSSKDFEDLLSSLQNLRSQYDGLPQKRLQALHQLEVNRNRLQLQAHLDGCQISHARIRGIGDARKATLQSYGIETAADIVDHRILAVPGFGPVALSNLMQWRNQQERQFRFNPNKGVDQGAKNVVERQILTEKIDLERKLNEGLSKLSVSSHHIITRRRTLLTQAEQAALDLAQAEADAGAGSTGKKGWIIWGLAVLGIGSLILASHNSHNLKGPSTPVPEQNQPVIPSPNQRAPLPPTPPKLPPHVEIDAKGQWQPTDGYDWVDWHHESVRWMPGEISRQYPHVIASDTEGQWRPADGYTWIFYPPRWGDMNLVKLIGEPQNQSANPPSAPPFEQGLADRADWQQWVAVLSGDFRTGAEWWAGHRSLKDPGACNGPAAAMNQQFILGCEAAKARLTPKDIKRKSDPDYRRGWNSDIGTNTPVPAPDSQAQAPAVDQGASAAPNDADTDAVKRLNEQELKRLKGR
jgi:DNA-binding helix-hairpin-helix protein with protein kinase domain